MNQCQIILANRIQCQNAAWIFVLSGGQEYPYCRLHFSYSLAQGPAPENTRLVNPNDQPDLDAMIALHAEAKKG